MSNYNTPYDDVFRTLLIDCSELIIPVVNEIFREDYTGNEKVTLKENELFLKYPNEEQEKRITDSSFTIAIGDVAQHYHVECQSTADGTMIIRIYEYDSQIALKEGKVVGNVLEVNFPRSAILYLRHNKNTPDNMVVKINTPGGSVSYDVPALKVKKYNIQTIFEKNLLFLIPFYIFTYEEQFPTMENDGEKLKKVSETYRYILGRLNRLCEEGLLDEYTKKSICKMTENVIEALTQKYVAIKKEVVRIMGGKVLDYEAKDILLRGRKEGRAEGRVMVLAELVQKNLLPVEDAAKQAGMSVEEFDQKVAELQCESQNRL